MTPIYNGVSSTLDELDADIYLLQEVDENSTRSYGTNEMLSFSEGRNAHSSVYALNYSCPFVPFPWPPIGKVNSGILTTADYAVQGGSAERIALPCPFSWPVRTANLKRCLLVSALPHRRTLDKELVVVNLHLEAYDDGEGKAAQTAMLFDILESEYAEGNYVIAGGDFNQTFPGTLDKWPIRAGEVWTPGVLEAESLPEGWSYVYDDSSPDLPPARRALRRRRPASTTCSTASSSLRTSMSEASRPRASASNTPTTTPWSLR